MKYIKRCRFLFLFEVSTDAMLFEAYRSLPDNLHSKIEIEAIMILTKKTWRIGIGTRRRRAVSCRR